MKKEIDLTSLFNPKSICIIGATENSLFVQKAINNLKAQGFNGKLYMVNPKYKSILGYTVYPSVLDIPVFVKRYQATSGVVASVVICGFIEGIQDKTKFIEVADQAIEKKKPINMNARWENGLSLVSLTRYTAKE